MCMFRGACANAPTVILIPMPYRATFLKRLICKPWKRIWSKPFHKYGDGKSCRYLLVEVPPACCQLQLLIVCLACFGRTWGYGRKPKSRWKPILARQKRGVLKTTRVTALRAYRLGCKALTTRR